MTTHVTAAVSVLADIGHLLESVDSPRQQLERALDMIGRLVAYERCALLDACSSASPGMVVVPAASPEEQDALHHRLFALYKLLSDHPLAQSGARDLPRLSAGTSRLAVPLIAVDEAVGILMVERKAAPYEEHHLQVLSVVGAQIAGYLANVRLRDEERLARRAMQRAADLLEFIKDGFLELDASLRCVTANHAALQLLGVERGELLGADARSIRGLGADASFASACDRALRDRVEVEVQAERFGSTDRWFELDLYPTELGVSVFLRDVTDRRAAAEYRELVTAIVGHDLKTPLAAISLGAQALLRTDGLDERVAGVVGRMARSAARMSEMVAQILDLTRIRHGKGLPIERRDADLGRVCCEVAGEVSAAHPEREIRCEVSGDLRGKWDTARLSQVVSNLVSNAVQHGSPSEPVRITARPSGSGDGPVVIEVHNEGAPIPEELLATIFQPFRQATGKATSGSLGLGLFIAESIVRAHGGSIEARSSRAGGTTFTVVLPRVT
ncbi:MAG: PAS domain-containing protein [Deltaproteobacteria bacterium]|nr:PAS domain-containing protein [Deltaproteobacteria bacterium]